MTPDGIRDDDWNRVRELAVEIVNATEEEAANRTKELLAHLDRLEHEYGALPSIVATRADYVEDPEEALTLLRHAYELANSRQDRKNMLYIASSLASLYIDPFQNADEAERWLRECEEVVQSAGDASDRRELDELAKTLQQLRQGARKDASPR